jgi:hypothetical protein
MKRSKQASPDELKRMADWCRIVIRFKTADRPGRSPAEAAIDSEYEKVLDATLARSDLRGLKMLRRDLTEWARGLPHRYVAELDALLRAQFGEGLTEEAKAQRKEVQDIVRRGYIETNDEYRLLVSYMDEIYSDPSRQEEAKAINALLAARDLTSK